MRLSNACSPSRALMLFIFIASWWLWWSMCGLCANARDSNMVIQHMMTYTWLFAHEIDVHAIGAMRCVWGIHERTQTRHHRAINWHNIMTVKTDRLGVQRVPSKNSIWIVDNVVAVYVNNKRFEWCRSHCALCVLFVYKFIAIKS